MRTQSSQNWATPTDITTKLGRQWASGRPLVAHASGEPWGPLRVAIRGPQSRDIVDRFDEVRAFKQTWQKFAARQPMRDHLRLESRVVGGRLAGANTLPSAVTVESVGHLSHLVGHPEVVGQFLAGVHHASALDARLRDWIIEHPKRSLNHVEILIQLLDAAVRVAAAGESLYVREIDVPDVDTKFIERNRGMIAELAAVLSADERPGLGVHRTSSNGRLGLREKPRYVRMRLLKSAHGFPPGISEVSVRTDELSADLVSAARIFIVENETTYLTFPEAEDAVVAFGDGYSAGTVATVPWLAEREVFYWGDIDTYGFGILNNLRSQHPSVRSIMMDRQTLLDHDRQWVEEDPQLRTHLPHLTDAERALYRELLGGDLGDRVRLEQERVGVAYLERCLMNLLGARRAR